MFTYTKFLTRFILLILLVCMATLPVLAQDVESSLIITGDDAITANGSALTLKAIYNDVNVTSSAKWSIVRGGEFARVDLNGILTPLSNGEVTVMAVYTPNDGQADSYSALKTINVTNQQIANSNVHLSVSVESAGHIYARVNGGDAETNWFYGKIIDYPQGTTFTFTAKETTNDFLYWKDVYSRRILTTDHTYTLSLGSDVSIVAVFRTPDKTKKLSLFENKNGCVLQSDYVSTNSTGYITVPKKPTTPGYTFDAWYMNGDRQSIVANNTIPTSSFDSDRIYIANYIPNSQSYSVKIIGGSGSGNYKYDATVTAILDESAIPEGKKFAYWANENNVASYDKEYLFRVGANAVISAVYADDETQERSPIIFISTAKVSLVEKKITFLAERNLPLDYELVETGILMNMNSNFNLSTNGALKIVSFSKESSGQFSARKSNVSNNVTWYAKAYMIYKKDDINYTIYSNTVNARL